MAVDTKTEEKCGLTRRNANQWHHCGRSQILQENNNLIITKQNERRSA